MKEQNIKAEKNKINFIIPDFLNVKECLYFLGAFQNHFEIYKDEVNLIGFSGMFPGLSWNKRNKIFEMYKYRIDILENVKNKYKSLKISLFIFFDKEEISTKDLEDEYANKVMSIFNDKNNYVVCKSNRLANYIRENYKEIKVIEYLEGNSKDSEYLIVEPSENVNENLFDLKVKNKLIMYPDGGYIPNRSWLFKHSKKDSVLNKIDPKKDKYFTSKSYLSFYEIKHQDSYLSYDKLIEYSEKGIKNFILSGFGVYNIAMIENIVDYLFKEEYKKDQRLYIHECNKILIEQEERAIHNYEM